MIDRKRIAEYINRFGTATLSMFPPLDIQGRLPEDADAVCVAAHTILGYMKEFMKGQRTLYNVVWVIGDQQTRFAVIEETMDQQIALFDDGKLEASAYEVEGWRTASADAHLAIEVYKTAFESLLEILCDEN